KHDRRALATSGKFRNFYKLPVGAFFQINEKSPLSPLNLLRNQFLTIPAIFGIERLRHDISRENVDRKSTRLNSSHVKISYAVFCLKKKREDTQEKLCA